MSDQRERGERLADFYGLYFFIDEYGKKVIMDGGGPLGTGSEEPATEEEILMWAILDREGPKERVCKTK